MSCHRMRVELRKNKDLESQLLAIQAENEKLKSESVCHGDECRIRKIEELEYKLMVQTETALQERAKREQAEAQAAVHQKMVEDLINSRNIQRNNADGSYMCGILNGLELAVSIFTGDEPEFAENTAGAELLAELEALRREVKELRNGATDLKQCV